MTLVGPKEESVLPIMLSVQQQQHHHHGLHATSSAQTHRGNVIVSTSSMPTGSNNTLQHGCKRSKIYGQAAGPYGTVPLQPASVARRNARERNRVKQVNNGFATLRNKIPLRMAQERASSTTGTHSGSRAGSKKLSKVETLRMAVEYIRYLQRILEEHDGDNSGSSPISSTSSNSPACGSDNGIGSYSSHPAELRLRGINEEICHDGSPHGSDLHQHDHFRQNPSPTFVPTTCSEASSSPTPSYVSEASSAGSQGYSTSSTLYATHSESYENYDLMSSEDDDLLEAICCWQQSQ